MTCQIDLVNGCDQALVHGAPMCTTACPDGIHILARLPVAAGSSTPDTVRRRPSTYTPGSVATFAHAAMGGTTTTAHSPVFVQDTSNPSSRSSGHVEPRVASSTAHMRPSALRSVNSASRTPFQRERSRGDGCESRPGSAEVGARLMTAMDALQLRSSAPERIT
jgi:hypothetical protein